MLDAPGVWTAGLVTLTWLATTLSLTTTMDASICSIMWEADVTTGGQLDVPGVLEAAIGVCIWQGYAVHSA